MPESMAEARPMEAVGRAIICIFAVAADVGRRDARGAERYAFRTEAGIENGRVSGMAEGARLLLAGGCEAPPPPAAGSSAGAATAAMGMAEAPGGVEGADLLRYASILAEGGKRGRGGHEA